MTGQDQEDSMFEQFLNKFVKIVYDDFGNPKLARGVLIKYDNNFIFLKGDYNEQVIAISKIQKVSLGGGRK